MKQTPHRIGWSLACVLTAVAFLTAACGGSAQKIPIKLAENPWAGSSINVNVAKIILEKELGYEVEIVSVDENAQWPALATGDLSASLEVWPSGHGENIRQYIDEQKVVENIGGLGVIGKIGWYVPTYVIEQNPALATWEGFMDPANAALFATAETGEMGQFLAGDPSYVQYDADIITNLGLPLQVVSTGSEQSELAALDAAISRGDPLLMYLWTPHSVHAKHDLTEVQLPPYSEECYAGADSGGVACDYPPDTLLKIAWSELKDKAPDAYTFLKNFQLTNDAQIQMLGAIEVDGQSVEEATQAWVDGNEATWKAWLP